MIQLQERQPGGDFDYLSTPLRFIITPNRFGFDTPEDYNDHELICGGYTRHIFKNDGKCGICGDAWDLPKPRPHEYGGKFGKGVTVRKYDPGSEIMIKVEVTSFHFGHFEFRVCEDINAPQECLDKHLLKVINGTPSAPTPSDVDTCFYPRYGPHLYEIYVKLPGSRFENFYF